MTVLVRDHLPQVTYAHVIARARRLTDLCSVRGWGTHPAAIKLDQVTPSAMDTYGLPCQLCTFINPISAMACAVCNARLPDGRERDQEARKAAAKKEADEEAAKQAEARRLAVKPTTRISSA